MSARVWLTIPSARPVAELEPVLEAWRDQGYGIALLRQGEFPKLMEADTIILATSQYEGWAPSINILAKQVLANVPNCQWIVGGGDDTYPDPKRRAWVIAEECEAHFGSMSRWPIEWRDTFGVMQPTGHRHDDTPVSRRIYGQDRGASIDRFAGSPWMGRAWCERALGGKGPLWGEFFHMFGDEHLQCCARRLGVFQQRPDLTHLHQHWTMEPGKKPPAFAEASGIYTRQHWNESQALFDKLAAAGFAEADEVVR